MKRVEYFKTPNGQEPARSWFEGLTAPTRTRVRSYIDRAAMGGAKKNIRPLGGGLFEIKIDHGPGYRVYFGETGNTVILLLLGGDKSTQFRDIRQAKDFWRSYVS